MVRLILATLFIVVCTTTKIDAHVMMTNWGKYKTNHQSFINNIRKVTFGRVDCKSISWKECKIHILDHIQSLSLVKCPAAECPVTTSPQPPAIKGVKLCLIPTGELTHQASFKIDENGKFSPLTESTEQNCGFTEPLLSIGLAKAGPEGSFRARIYPLTN